MQQALDALENSVDRVLEDAYQAEKFYGNYPTRQGKVNGLKVLADDHEKAITALRERLAHCDRCGKRLGGEGDIHTCTPDPIGDAQDKLIAELAAQPEQEPYGWVQPNPSFNSGIFNLGSACPSGWVGSAIDVYTTPPAAAQHQCKWPTCQSEKYQQALAEQINRELITGVAQRKPLTDAEIQAIHDTYYRRMGPQEFARAIEAAHNIKEKNT
jgi:hypothetical protein